MEALSQVLAEVTAALDSAEIRYAIGGSVASSARGVWRSTLDVDVVAAMPLGEARIPCTVTSAEDILLAKLRWYRDGGEVSDRQWNNIVGLITTGTSLDNDYLQLWAARLRVNDLLEKAKADAQPL